MFLLGAERRFFLKKMRKSFAGSGIMPTFATVFETRPVMQGLVATGVLPL